MTAFQMQLQSLKRQVDASPWLKWAGVVIALLLAFFIVQGLDALRSQRQKAAIETELNLRRILALKGQDIWFERKKSSLQLRDSLQAQLPEVATAGLAQAALQTWLRTLTSGFGTEENVTIHHQPDSDVQGRGLRLRGFCPGNLRDHSRLAYLV